MMEQAPVGSDNVKEQLRWDYICTLHKVVDEADVVLLVLDAHGPAEPAVGGGTQVRGGGQAARVRAQ